MVNVAWNEERRDMVRKLAAQKYTASEIAAEMSAALGVTITRNAIIGQVARHKIKLLNPSGGQRSGAGQKPKEAAQRMPGSGGQGDPKNWAAGIYSAPPPAPVAEPAIAVPASTRVTISDLRESSCRWPIGHPGEPGFTFCGAARLTSNVGSMRNPYCAEHSALAYAEKPKRVMPDEEKERRRHAALKRKTHAFAGAHGGRSG